MPEDRLPSRGGNGNFACCTRKSCNFDMAAVREEVGWPMLWWLRLCLGPVSGREIGWLGGAGYCAEVHRVVCVVEFREEMNVLRIWKGSGGVEK